MDMLSSEEKEILTDILEGYRSASRRVKHLPWDRHKAAIYGRSVKLAGALAGLKRSLLGHSLLKDTRDQTAPSILSFPFIVSTEVLYLPFFAFSSS